MDQRLEKAIGLREAGQHEAARALLKSLAEERPYDPVVLYQCAWAHDALGLEREAVPFYERAIASGLAGDDLRGALLGLGSTFRALGMYGQSLATLREGIATFPDDKAMQVFLAMTLYNNGSFTKAMSLLLHNLAETSSDERIARYRRAILFYADRLDETWE